MRSDRFILIFFWATFVFFTASGSRRGYYLLPILPAAAVLVARLLLRRDELSIASRRLFNFGFWTIAAATLCAVALVFPLHAVLPWPWSGYLPVPARGVLALFLAGTIAVLAYTWISFTRERIIAALCVIGYLSMSYIYVFLIPATNAWHDEPEFAQRVVARLGASNSHLGLFQPFGVLGPLFYMDPPGPLPAFYEPSQLEPAVADGRIGWVLVRRKDIPAGTGGTIVDGQRSFPFEGPDERRHEVVLMRVGRNLGN